jgi:uncharacterized membrane protein YjfL (UPF0719 family)
MGGTLYVTAFAVTTTLALLLLALLLRRGIVRANPGTGGGASASLKTSNDAQRLEAVGEVLAVFVIAAATVRESVQGESVVRDAAACAVFGALALTATTVLGRLGVRLLLGRLKDELARDNKAAGIAAAGQLVSSALVTSRAVVGSDLRGIGLSLVFFVLAQATLLLFVSLFRALTTYDDAEQIHGENVAASVSYAGVAVAIGIVVARAVEGDFEGWRASLEGYGGVLLSLLALWPVRQLFVQTLLLRAPLHVRGGALDAAIAERRSTGTAALEAASYVATALAIYRVA